MVRSAIGAPDATDAIDAVYTKNENANAVTAIAP